MRKTRACSQGLRATLLASAITVTITPGAVAGDDDSPRVFGWLERAVVMPVDTTVKAKLDTGALTSSIHATDIGAHQQDGKDWVDFTIEFKDADSGEKVVQALSLPVKRFIRVRGAGGEDRRPVVMLDICIGGQVYNEQFSLRDRSDMLYPVLIGRRLLRDLGPVDVNATYVTQPACDGGHDEA